VNNVMHPPFYAREREPLPIVKEDGLSAGEVWTVTDNLVPTEIRSLDGPGRSESLYRLGYPTPQDK
jgi:hypothetical protein